MACASICRSRRPPASPSGRPRGRCGAAKPAGGIRPRTLGADTGSHGRDVVRRLRRQHSRPHLARVAGWQAPGLDGRTTRTVGDAVSQRLRKRVEEIFGWMNTGGLRKTRVRGVARTPHAACLVGAAYTLLRISRLRAPVPAT